MPEPPFITYEHSIAKTEGYSFEITRLLSGSLELSALYSFQFLIKLTKEETADSQKDCLQIMKALLGSRIQVTISAGGSLLQTIHGLIMSIESTTQYARGDNAGWYVWTVRPELAKACYSINRQVFSERTAKIHEGSGLSASPSSQVLLLPSLIDYFRRRWHTTLTFSDKARAKIPCSIQYRQNDESDYNFLTRLLSSWGLGYAWQFGSQQEELCIFDATDAGMDREAPVFSPKKKDNNDKPSTDEPHIIEPASLSASLWKLNYGVQDLAAAVAPDIENYNKASELSGAPHISLHDETWDQLIDEGQRHRPDAIHLSAHDNAYSCHGVYVVKLAGDVDNAEQLYPGAKVDWKSSTSLQSATGQPFYITRMRFDAADLTWRATVDGHTPTANAGLGILPRPVRVNNRPDLCAEELITCDAWPEPRTRIFLAVVEDSSVYLPSNGSDGKSLAGLLSSRNLCCVREIAKHTVAPSVTSKDDLTLENTLWVELGSPFADNDSGLLTRPRKGNVLVCLDRGDLSIPLAISSLFRDNNATPFAKLQTMERHTRQKQQDTIDSTTVTLRNRVQLPPRSYDSDSSHSDVPIDLTPEGTNTTRPLSVTQLAEKPLPFSQIQLVSRDNGTKPIPHNNGITRSYVASSVIETVAGTLSDTDSSGSYVMANTAKIIQSQLNAPTTRPHFEGINMYSSCDVLLQSADHQLFNAGGEIVLTADKGITLRVGKSSIKITESGIEIISGTGIVTNPGAYPAYHPADSTQVTRLMNNSTYPLSGSIVIDSSGVALKGPYISNTVTNLFKASTFLGSVFSVSDYAAKLYAPKTTIIGGAAVESTSMTIVPSALKFIVDISETGLGRDSVYVGALKDGWKTTGPNLSSISGSIVSGISTAFSWGLGLSNLVSSEGFASLLSITGSMVKLEPTTLTLSGQNTTNYQSHLIEVNTPLAGFCAMAERATRRNLLKGAPNSLITQPEVMAATMFILDAERLISNASRKSSGSGGDTFSSPNASYSSPSVKGGNIAEQTIMGVVGCAAYIGLAYGYYKLMNAGFNWLQNLLYLGKRDYAWGIAKIEAIRESTSTLQKKIDSVDNKLLALNGEDTRVKSSCQNALGAMDNIRFINKSVNHTRNVANQITQCLTNDEKEAICNRAISIDTASGQLTTHNGQQINI